MNERDFPFFKQVCTGLSFRHLQASSHHSWACWLSSQEKTKRVMGPYLDYLATMSNQVSFYFLFWYQCDISKLSTLDLSSCLSPPVQACTTKSVHLSFLFFFSFSISFIYLCLYVCMCVHVHKCAYVCVSWYAYGGQIKIWGSPFFSTMLVLKTQFRSSDWWQISLPTEPFSRSISLFLIPFLFFPLPSFFLFLYLSCWLFAYLPASLAVHRLQLICDKGALICQDCFTILRWQSLAFQFSLEIMGLFIYFALLCNFFSPECQH